MDLFPSEGTEAQTHWARWPARPGVYQIMFYEMDFNGEYYHDILEQINDLHEDRLDNPDLENNIHWQKAYTSAMDKIFNIHMQRIALLEAATSYKV
jgi:hypothetical protein